MEDKVEVPDPELAKLLQAEVWYGSDPVLLDELREEAAA